jgi:hypothetical protein
MGAERSGIVERIRERKTGMYIIRGLLGYGNIH